MESNDYAIMLNISFTPGIPLKDRHQLEHDLEEALADRDLGEVDGGGEFVDGSESNIYLYVSEVEPSLAVVREVLQAANVARSTTIRQEDPEERDFAVYP